MADSRATFIGHHAAVDVVVTRQTPHTLRHSSMDGREASTLISDLVCVFISCGSLDPFAGQCVDQDKAVSPLTVCVMLSRNGNTKCSGESRAVFSLKLVCLYFHFTLQFQTSEVQLAQ